MGVKYTLHTFSLAKRAHQHKSVFFIKSMSKDQRIKKLVEVENSKLMAVPFNESIGLLILKKVAKITSGGHYTIFRFTKHYGVMLGTPFAREDIENSIKGETLEEAIRNLLLTFNFNV